MIYVGLAGWGDHDDLYIGPRTGQSKLEIYAGHFPIVEIDSSFYAVQPLRNMEKWVFETPSSFQFVVKAYQGMTGHQRGFAPFETKEEMFEAFRQSLVPLLSSSKLAMVLCQFPPWFDCKKEHVQWIRYVKEQLQGLPVALEFRHRSWFEGPMKKKTLQYMREEEWIHSICDEPQAGTRSIPTILEPTNDDKTLIRFHGRNVHGWNDPGDGTWRDVRYLYKYNEEELQAWKEHINKLTNHTKDIFIIFNNNSGGDAATNAKQLIERLQIEYHGLAPRQLDLFS
ncbi:DUF72 domain-containing protein [Alkalihalobacillus sp. MEB130]|uniref:DUF72 domain-containing protein n=1 Tax=Alkalihalobacillus sp. MEB130 TaxID=2976704 RepID=UPI0028DD8F36|nr:DUF72 domain-containing protein [Alkalihalobacillus sp. MEB130]MDT8858681.1 DUF72 domain-containing protein [Alkalihalobacillus sp. MEB130]